MAIFPSIKPPPAPCYKRPHDLVYALADKPPPGAMAVLALQHAATALAFVAYALAAAKIGGMSAHDTRTMVAATILSMALSGFLQSWGGRTGSGMLIVHIPDPLIIIVVGGIIAAYGLGGMVAIGVANGITALCAGMLIPRLRAIFPPIVAGVVVCIGGLSLVSSALHHAGGIDALDRVTGTDALISLTTLAVIIALSIWGSRQAKLLALLAGLAVGILLSVALGRVHGLHLLAAAPTFGLPVPPHPVFHLDIGAIAAVVLLALMTQLDSLGSIVLMHKMNDADWRRPDMRAVGGGIRANGLGNVLCAWLGAYPTGTSSANIALCHISRSTSRWIGFATAALLALIAFLPKVTIALTLIPLPVIGAVEIYASAYLIVSGIELIASRALDSRAIFMIGLAFIAGLGTMLLPGLADLAPPSLRFMAHSAIIVGGLVAIILNLLFRLGTSRRARLDLDQDGDTRPLSRKVVEFVEENGARWSARRDVVHRAAQAALEASEAISAAGDGRRPAAIRGSFDEFNLDIELVHSGPPLRLDPGQRAVPARDLLDIDDADFDAALDHAMAGVSHVLLKRLADRLYSGRRDGLSFLRLHFDH